MKFPQRVFVSDLVLIKTCNYHQEIKTDNQSRNQDMQVEQASETIVTSYNQPIPQSFREVKRKTQASKQASKQISARSLVRPLNRLPTNMIRISQTHSDQETA
jgi:hypothetical protein